VVHRRLAVPGQERSSILLESFLNVGIMMIRSAEEFVALRTSTVRAEYERAATEEASVKTWTDVVLRFPEMRSWVAHNKAVPLEILKVLAKDTNLDVRAAVAEKRKLDRELFEILSRDPNDVVRQRIAYNKKTPVEIIERLVGDDAPFVRAAALEAHRRIRDSGR
jgi:hypothetical protein